MANNRMYLRCKKCGSIFYLAKDSGLGYYYENYYKEKGSLEKQLNDFLDKHNPCFCEKNEKDIREVDTPMTNKWFHFENCFEIAYETEYEEPKNENAGLILPKDIPEEEDL